MVKRSLYRDPPRLKAKIKKPRRMARLPKVLRDALNTQSKPEKIADDMLEILRPVGTGREGVRGAKPGKSQRMTQTLKDAILYAASDIGEDGTGKNGLVGYLKYIAVMLPEDFVGLLKSVIPLQINNSGSREVVVSLRTAEEVRADLARTGIYIEGSVLGS